MKRQHFFYIFFCLLISCVDPISFDVPRDVNFLLVDGFITDKSGPHTIRLARSSPYSNTLDGGVEEAVSAAAVSIIDNHGVEIFLTETIPGNYATGSDFSGQTGNSYFLRIKIDGKSYESTKETILPASPIETVTHDYITKPFINEFDNVEDNWGIEFYATFESSPEVSYYKWDWVADYVIVQELFHAEQDPTMPDTCYVNQKTSGYVNLLQGNQNAAFSTEHPVSFVPADFKFNIKYGMNIVQYALSDQAAEFWEQVEKQINISGSIFDPTPARIVGNIKNTQDEDEEVLGYFGAYGQSDRRVFLDNLDVTVLLDLDTIFHDDLDICALANPAESPNFCFNCWEFPGSQSQKPDFWE